MLDPKPIARIHLLAYGEPVRYRGSWDNSEFIIGELVEPITHTLVDDIDIVFKDSPKYDHNGLLIEYTLHEELPD